MGEPWSHPGQHEAPLSPGSGPLARLRGEGLWSSLLLAAAALLAGLLLPLDSRGEISADFFLEVPCVFHLATGLPCPLCGMTRAFANLSRLQIAQAVVFSPAGSAIYLFLIGYSALGWSYAFSGWRALLPWLRRDYLGLLVLITIMGWPVKLLIELVAAP
ncbi:MAG: DUF2752 domain-containing protein [Desulfarculus sp.]|nr:DUF2752 domain-containing protein [Desulfarculus sp.]